jgi:glutamyl-tRNA reductase
MSGASSTNRGAEAPPPHSANRRAEAPPLHSALASLRALTLSHHSVGLSALPAFSLGCDRAMALNAALTSGGVPSVVLITCNRTEIYWQSRGAGDDALVRALVTQALGPASPMVLAARATLSGGVAAGHLMRVASGLESLVVGEAEVLGQVRAALEACPGASPLLTAVFHAAIRAGRMARAETAIGLGAQSVASAAVRLLAQQLPLTRARVAVVGAGDTGARTARHLQALGAAELIVLNRTASRASRLGATAGGEAAGLDRLPLELARADAMIFAVAVTRPLVEATALAAAVGARGGRPITIVDLSMPAAVEPADLAGVRWFDLAAIERGVAADRQRRAAEVPKVEAVLARELAMLERRTSRRGPHVTGAGLGTTALEAAG